MNTTPSEMKRLLLTPRDAARMLAVSERTLWQLTKDGIVPAIKVGPRLVRYCENDLRATIERMKREQRASVETIMQPAENVA